MSFQKHDSRYTKPVQIGMITAAFMTVAAITLEKPLTAFYGRIFAKTERIAATNAEQPALNQQ